LEAWSMAQQAREADVQARWAAGSYRGTALSIEGREAYTPLYEGRRGGAAGPDFRDAVLLRGNGQRGYGDVEIHLRAGSRRAHGDDRDPRYDGVVLHVVLMPSRERETALANGLSAPIVALGACQLPDRRGAVAWPCASLAAHMHAAEMHAAEMHAAEMHAAEM